MLKLGAKFILLYFVVKIIAPGTAAL